VNPLIKIINIVALMIVPLIGVWTMNKTTAAPAPVVMMAPTAAGPVAPPVPVTTAPAPAAPATTVAPAAPEAAKEAPKK